MYSHLLVAVMALASISPVAAKKGKCDGNWAPDSGMEDYTKIASNAQSLTSTISGRGPVDLTASRTANWTTSVEDSLTFDDILSLGISFSSSIVESLTDSQPLSYMVTQDAMGLVDWQAFLRCSTGSGTCQGTTVSGEVCTPYLDKSSGSLVGMFTFVQTG